LNGLYQDIHTKGIQESTDEPELFLRGSIDVESKAKIQDDEGEHPTNYTVSNEDTEKRRKQVLHELVSTGIHLPIISYV
jgi:hypothetical protein